jgi:hypothetical protein
MLYCVFILNYKEKYMGKAGLPNEFIYMYNTDQKVKANPYLLPTSIVIKNQFLAQEVFGFVSKVVDFDVKSKILTLSKSDEFKLTKQVEIEW